MNSFPTFILSALQSIFKTDISRFNFFNDYRMVAANHLGIFFFFYFFFVIVTLLLHECRRHFRCIRSIIFNIRKIASNSRCSCQCNILGHNFHNKRIIRNCIGRTTKHLRPRPRPPATYRLLRARLSAAVCRATFAEWNVSFSGWRSRPRLCARRPASRPA